jgi:hypothetical protein
MMTTIIPITILCQYFYDDNINIIIIMITTYIYIGNIYDYIHISYIHIFIYSS